MAFDGEAFGQHMVEIVRGYVEAELEPLRAENKVLADRIAELEAREVALPLNGEPGAPGRDGVDCDMAEVERMLEAKVSAAVETLPAPKDGADGEAGAPGRDGLDGKDVTDEQVAERVAAYFRGNPPAPGRDGSDGNDGAPGRDADMDAITAIVRGEIAELVAAAVAELDSAIRDVVEQAVSATIPEISVEQTDRVLVLSFTRGEVSDSFEIELPVVPGEPGPQGPEGPQGKMRAAAAWTDAVHYEGDIRTHCGATYQAARDTGREPPHEDWILLASAGRDGANGRSFSIRGTWQEDAEYGALDVVALNGAAFVAKVDNPGPCPGDGWQLMSAQGKRGATGERGVRGEKGDQGAAGTPVTGLQTDDEGMLTLKNADGSAVQCDLYPLLSRLVR